MFIFILKLLHHIVKHWDDNSWWMLVEDLFMQVMSKAKEVFAFTKYLAIIIGEVTTTYNHSWISIHAHSLKNFYMQLTLVSLGHLIVGPFASRLAICILDTMSTHIGILVEDSCKEIVSFC